MSIPNIDISIQCQEWPDVAELIDKAVQKLFELHALESEDSELSIVLADDAFIQNLNKDWRNKDKPTNVLSFPQEHPSMLGDIIMALETIQREAQAQDKPFDDHVTHLIIHGILHLLGFDHETDEEAQEMETLEVKILGEIGVENPYADTDSVS